MLIVLCPICNSSHVITSDIDEVLKCKECDYIDCNTNFTYKHINGHTYKDKKYYEEYYKDKLRVINNLIRQQEKCCAIRCLKDEVRLVELIKERKELSLEYKSLLNIKEGDLNS